MSGFDDQNRPVHPRQQLPTIYLAYYNLCDDKCYAKLPYWIRVVYVILEFSPLSCFWI